MTTPQISQVELSLRVGSGKPGPAPADLMRALRRVEVTQSDQAPSGFQLTFGTEVVDAGAEDFATVQSTHLEPFSRVLLRVTVDGAATTLIDGFITHQQFMPGNGPEESTFVVTGEDVSVRMDMVQASLPYLGFTDSMLALEILGKWAVIGIMPDVVPALSGMVPYDHTPQQTGSDRQTVQQLAQDNGYVFYVTPSDTLFENTAYWGPPRRDADPQGVLRVAAGPFNNVERISFAYNGLAPVAFVGLVEQTLDLPDLPYVIVPIVTVGGTREPFATKPALSPESIASLNSRVQLWPDQQLNPVKAQANAQGATNLSTDGVVTAQCSVSVTRTGAVYRAPGVVGVAGCGSNYDGKYYLQSATHEISLTSGREWDYRQSLTLTREGLGTTTTRLEA